MKALKSLSLLLVIFIVSGLSYIYFVLSMSKPVMNGEIISDKLIGKVEVIRDSEGIPHIYADKRKDMYFALGFVMASDRLFQYDVVRRAGGGELSEIFGEKTLKIDKLFRTIGAKHLYEKKIEQLPEIIKSDYESFNNGLNYYLETYPLPIEFKILGYKPKPFTILDSYYVAAYMGYSFTPMLKEEVLMSQISQTVKNRDISLLTVMKEAIKDPSLVSLRSNLIDVEDVLQYLGPIEGSNAWVVSGDNTQSGFPILASDPHVTFSLPNLWYEAHINCKEDQYDMYGHFLPLIPYPAMGHNRHYGWGLTMSYVDDLDIFSTSGKIKNEVTEIIKVRGKEDVIIKIPWEEHGPHIKHIFPKEDMMMTWAFQKFDNRPILGFYNMSRANNLEEVKNALGLVKSPGVNVLYADSKKNFAHFLSGSFMKRDQSAYSSYLNSSDKKIMGEFDHNLKPHRINHEDGILVSTNDRPQDEKIDMRGSWYPKNRHDTVVELLKRSKKWTSEMMKSVQTSNLDIFSLKYKKIILNELRDKKFNSLELKALRELDSWKGESTIESIGASIYHQFNYEFFKVVLDELNPEQLKSYVLSTASWNFHKRMMEDLSNSWWDSLATKEVETGKDKIVTIFKSTVSSLKAKLGDDITKWNWGKIHTITYPHTFGMNKYLAPFFNEGPYPANGSINVINHFRRKGYTEGHAVKSGPSTRRIVDFGSPEVSLGILPLGISGHKLSPFYMNQRERFLKGEYRKQLLNYNDIQKDSSFTLNFKSSQGKL